MNIITRKEAKENGLKRYFTGKPCIHGHIAEKFTINGRCVGCSKEGYDCWAKKNPILVKEKNKKYYEKNSEYLKECAKKHREENPEYKKEWKEKNPEYYKEWGQNNRDKRNVNEAKRYTSKLYRSQPWADSEQIKL